MSVTGVFHWVIALACLAVAVSLQIGVNFANDYSDGIRGTDAYRVGPARLTASGRAKPRTVLTLALVFFALVAIAGVLVVIFADGALIAYAWLIGLTLIVVGIIGIITFFVARSALKRV